MRSLSGHNVRSERMIVDAKTKIIGRSDTNPPVDLYKHILPDGRVFTEFVQAIEYGRSGANVFLALKDSEGNIVQDSLWRPAALLKAVIL
jgi:hypothetical protein